MIHRCYFCRGIIWPWQKQGSLTFATIPKTVYWHFPGQHKR